MAKAEVSHEEFIETIARLAVSRLTDEERARCKARIVYGTGKRGTRGTCYYGTWTNGEPDPVDLVEICAFGEGEWIETSEIRLRLRCHRPCVTRRAESAVYGLWRAIRQRVR